MSLDQRRRQTPPQDHTVSNTNQGYQTTQQHILRETQQQRLVRPGQQFNFDNDENYLSSPAVTPQRQSFDAGCMNYGDRNSHAQFSYSGPINTVINVNPNNFNGANDFNLFSSDGQLTPSAFLDFSAGFENANETTNSANTSKRSSRRISGGIMNRVAQFENIAMQSQRPITPPNQNVSSEFDPPMNVIHTDFSRLLSPNTHGHSSWTHGQARADEPEILRHVYGGNSQAEKQPTSARRVRRYEKGG